MPDYKGTTRAQTIFLRAFIKNPNGPPADEWPSPVILRRWLKRPGFCGSMNSILRSLRYLADFHITAAAASGSHLLHGTIQGGDVEAIRKKVEALIQLMRMAHVRHRFAEPLPEPEPRGIDLIGMLQMAHPSIRVEEALECFDLLTEDDRKPGERGPGYAAWKRTGHPFGPNWKLPSDHGGDDGNGDGNHDGDSNHDDGDDGSG